MSNEELTQKVLALPLPERIDLAQALWQSIDEMREDDVNAEERKALELAKRRDRELTMGAVEGRSHQQVMEAARRALR
jgi:putative addiction module component (TIGR02574 family)